METLKDNVLHHETIVLKKMEQRSKPRRFNTKYVFKTSMEKHMLPKFIGKRGRNINELTSQILLSDNNHTNEDINVNISEDRKIRMKFLRFEHLKTDTNCDEKVLITVEMNTSNRDESFEIVKELVKQAVEKTNSNSYHSNYHSNEEQFYEESGVLDDLN